MSIVMDTGSEWVKCLLTSVMSDCPQQICQN